LKSTYRGKRVKKIHRIKEEIHYIAMPGRENRKDPKGKVEGQARGKGKGDER